jgi:membrane protein DedA with SNARE-associated domain
VETRKQKIFQYAVLATIVLVFYIFLIYLYKKLGLPSPEDIISFTQKYYEKYGYAVVLIGAIAEGALFINWYLPGSIVVALGVVFAKQAGLSVPIVLSLIITGFFLTAILNYLLGRFGWYHVFMKLGLEGPLKKVQEKVEHKGLRVLLSTYIHPNFGALAATAAGILRLPFGKFLIYSFLSIAAWNSLWTVIFYFFGSALLNHMNLLIIAGGVFVYFVFVKSFKETKVNIP